MHFQLGERLGLPMLVGKILALPRDDRWQTMARAALRDDVYAVHAQLTAQVLRSTDADDSAPARIAEWEEGDSLVVARAAATLEDICSDETGDLAASPSGSGWSRAPGLVLNLGHSTSDLDDPRAV